MTADAGRPTPTPTTRTSQSNHLAGPRRYAVCQRQASHRPRVVDTEDISGGEQFAHPPVRLPLCKSFLKKKNFSSTSTPIPLCSLAQLKKVGGEGCKVVQSELEAERRFCSGICSGLLRLAQVAGVRVRRICHLNVNTAACKRPFSLGCIARTDGAVPQRSRGRGG